MNDAQVENWRKMLIGQIGVAAFLLSRDDIVALRDRLQAQVDAVEQPLAPDTACACDPARQGKTIHTDGRITCNKCGKPRR